MSRRGAVFLAAFVVAGPAVLGAPVKDAGAARPAVTFTKDIAPILQRSCQICHRPDGMAPMSMLSYQDVRPYARAIKTKTAQRAMPPWFLEKDIGIQEFEDDPSLSDEEIAKISAWVDAGAPEGDRRHMPKPIKFPAGGTWSRATAPDLIVRSNTFDVEAVSPDRYVDLGTIPTGLTEKRWVKAIEVREVRPNESRQQVKESAGLSYFSLHHAVVSAGVAEDNETQDQVVDENTGGARRGSLNYTSEVGQNALVYPDDVGVSLEAGSSVSFGNTHIHAVGRPVTMQVEVGLWLHPVGFQPKYTQGPRAAPSRLAELDIPGNTDNIRHESVTVLKQAVKGVSFEPHLHASGKRMCMDVIYPDGRTETLNCAGYKHTWVKMYNYTPESAPLLPKGTILRTVGWYDNTSKNPNNVEPRNWHGQGRRSVDDMFINFSKWIFLTDEQYAAEVAAREQAKVTKAQQAGKKPAVARESETSSKEKLASR